MHVRIHLFAFSRMASIVSAVLMLFCTFCMHIVHSSAINRRYLRKLKAVSRQLRWRPTLFAINDSLFLPYFSCNSSWNTNVNGSLLCTFFASLKKKWKLPVCLCVRSGCVTTLIYFYHFKEFTRMFLFLFRLFDEYMCIENFFCCCFALLLLLSMIQCVWKSEQEWLCCSRCANNYRL